MPLSYWTSRIDNTRPPERTGDAAWGADIVILEENEAGLPGMKHSLDFRRIIVGE